MPDDSTKRERAVYDNIYRLTRIDTERAVDKLVSAMRDRTEEAIEPHRRSREIDADANVESALTEAALNRIANIRLSYSTAFAHALLQGAADAFEDHKAGLTILKRLIDVELAELEQDENFLRLATSYGSNAIN